MHKHRFHRLVLCIFALLRATSALAAAPATANQELMLYAAPGSTELSPLPQHTEVIAIDSETSDGSDWILVETKQNGLPLRGYVRADMLSLQGEIPRAIHSNNVNTILGVTVFSAPAADAPVRGEAAQFSCVTVLGFDCSYIFVEYTDPATDQPSRGWMKDWAVQIERDTYYADRLPPSAPATGSAYIDMHCTALTTLYSEPDAAYPTTILVPEGAAVRCFGELYCGFSIVEYGGNKGYIQTSFLSAH